MVKLLVSGTQDVLITLGCGESDRFVVLVIKGLLNAKSVARITVECKGDRYSEDFIRWSNFY